MSVGCSGIGPGQAEQSPVGAAPGFSVASAPAALGNPARNLSDIGSSVDAQLSCPERRGLIERAFVSADDDARVLRKQVSASRRDRGEFGDGCLSCWSGQLLLPGVPGGYTRDLCHDDAVCLSAGHSKIVERLFVLAR